MAKTRTSTAPKRGNGLGSTPVEIPRKGRPNTWGIRTPLHFDKAQGKKVRYWIGREYENKTKAERALRKWINDYEAGNVAPRSDIKLGQWLDRWFSNVQVEETTKAGYGPKIRLHIKPHLGTKKVQEVTDDDLDALYRMLERTPCPTKRDGKPLGASSVRKIHDILFQALEAAVEKDLLTKNPARTANPPTERKIKAQVPDFPTLTDEETADFLSGIWKPCGDRGCGDFHHCTRDSALWTTYAANGPRRSEALGMMKDLIHWDDCAIELDWVVVEVGNTYVLRRLTKDGDDKPVIYADQALMNVLKRQVERVEIERDRAGDLWVEHGLIFPRDTYRLRKDGPPPGGPQDPEKVSARWRRTRERLKLPEDFRLHDWRGSRITNDLEAGENPVEVSANARHHSPGYTMERYGRRRPDNARRLAASGASRIGLTRIA
ncbi:hypothetical protein SSP35_03_03410 [Streptomyces sp. NBRC 110611]|uniref:tyrosine-type recombinase/integrase n=1 Tax=Streptomyces sp. NBRC 110611 TaxID=1621259 RepID=UPI00082C8075|nr:hypothetical protein [Streptomyces sp. NBRC 110611]GAU66693.1 hypothetical protein SSP35_03_03410 [Streptomyces sp. NBRC 110611]